MSFTVWLIHIYVQQKVLHKWDIRTKCEVKVILEMKPCLAKHKTNPAPVILLIEVIKFHLTCCVQNDARTRREKIFFSLQDRVQ